MKRLGSLAAVLAILALSWPRAAAAGTVDVPGSACSPSSDSAPAIASFLARVPNGSTVLFPAGARCEVVQPLDLSVPPSGQPERTDTVFDLNGATIFRTEEPSCRKLSECNRPIVVLSLVNGVSLENGTVEGGYHTSGLPNFDSTREHDHAIVVHGASHVRLSGLTVRDVAGDCVDVDRQKRTDTSRVTIVGTQGAPFTCTGTGRQGISANSVTGLRIEGVTFDRIAASGVDLEPRRHGFLKDVMVIGNRFGWIGNYAIAGIGSSATWQDITVADNAQTDPAHPGLGFLRAGNSFDRGPLTLTGNRMVNIVQINHTSGRATGNTLVGRPGFDCWFELFNHPPFQVQGNSHPQRVSETCSKLGKIAGSVRPIVRKLKLIAIFIGIAVLVLGVVVGLLVRRRQRRNPDRYVD